MPQIIALEPLAQMLRSIALLERTGILRVEQLGERQVGRGELYFEKGRLIRAYCGQQTGRAAIQQINAWIHISCSFHNIPLTTRQLHSSRAHSEGHMVPRLAAVPHTENLRPDLASALAEHFQGRRPAEQPGKHPHVLDGPATDTPAADITHASRWQESPLPLTPFPSLQPAEETLPGRNAIFKARSMVATARIIERMERRERIIFILLDGRRTILDIARLIHQPESEVEHILVHLTQRGYTQYIQG